MDSGCFAKRTAHAFIRALVAGGIIFGTSSSSLAYRVIVNSACPQISPSNLWTDYLSAKFPRSGRLVSGVAEVQFREAKALRAGIRATGSPLGMTIISGNLLESSAIADPIGGLDSRFCYNIRFDPNTRTFLSWYAAGGNSSPTKGGLAADPSQNEINVFGVLFLFTEAGDVINFRGEVVGHLYCYLSNECGGY